MVAQLGEPRLVGIAPERLEVCLPGTLGVDDHGLSAGQLDDEVGAQAPFLGSEVMLGLEVAVLEHAGHLDHATELDLAPAAADVRPVAQRADEVARLAAELLLRLGELAHLGRELRVGPGARDLELLQLPVHFRERFLDRRDEVLDRLLALVEVVRRLRLELLELRLREREEGFAARCERVGRE